MFIFLPECWQLTFLCYNQYADSDGFPSGQRERTVNPLSQTTMVRIHPRPPFFLFCGNGGIGRRVRFRSVWGQLHAGSSPVSRTMASVLTAFEKLLGHLFFVYSNFFVAPRWGSTLCWMFLAAAFICRDHYCFIFWHRICKIESGNYAFEQKQTELLWCLYLRLCICI